MDGHPDPLMVFPTYPPFRASRGTGFLWAQEGNLDYTPEWRRQNNWCLVN